MHATYKLVLILNTVYQIQNTINLYAIFGEPPKAKYIAGDKVVKEELDTKQDIMQYSTMPSAQDNLGKIVQYIGTNTANYTNGYFYK